MRKKPGQSSNRKHHRPNTYVWQNRDRTWWYRLTGYEVDHGPYSTREEAERMVGDIQRLWSQVRKERHLAAERGQG